MIATRNLSKRYGIRSALEPLTTEFADGGTTALIGPSGCGKSTLLRLLAGLIVPTTGSVELDGAILTPLNVNELRHRIGYVIQDGGLFPHLTARGNATLMAKHLRKPSAEIARRLEELCALTRFPDEMLDRYPSELSGGQRQRVSLMRALMLDPEWLLLDEPLGALDPITRYELQTELKAIFERLKKTVVLVTHDMGEAAYFATSGIVLMREGRVVQQGSATDLIHHPAEPFAEQFIRAQRGPMDWKGSSEA